jgi:hypothetical protein
MDNVKATLANLAVSGIKVSPFCEDLMYKIQNKEISYSQALVLIKEKYMNELHNRIYEAFEEETDDIEVIESGEWEREYKDYFAKEFIVKYDGKYYSIVEHRSGSYYTDYNYDEPIITEVEPKIETVVITKWVTKK